MAKLRTNGTSKKKPTGIVKLRTAVEKLHKISLLLVRKLESSYYDDIGFGDSHENEDVVPEDVKEGHFAVVAVDGGRTKRYVVPLSCLSHPGFVGLLELAAEEFGFDHGGALTVPCRPCELERILAEGRDQSGDYSGTDDGMNWGWFL